MVVKSFLLLAKTLQLFRRTPQTETPIVKQWRLQKQPILHTGTPWTFQINCQEASIPQSLRSLIEIILGRWSYNIIQNQAALTVSQLIRFNSVVRCCKDSSGESTPT
ncbi:unnamed protein product [Porites evermanni]|uniref:Uncharacterized protein n=1 Tax=Porites evermanni TaxID=104178 RepID=A0ABN8MG09_9CNID|nr:unnamed protein product [Porites evermanni]